MPTATMESCSEADYTASFRAYVRTWGAFRNVMEAYFAEFGMSGSQWGVLRSLHTAEREGEASLRQNELAERLLVQPPSVTAVVARLERLGLVARRRASADARAKEVSLTPEGRRLTARVFRRHPAQMRFVLGAFSPDEVRILREFMERMSNHLLPQQRTRAREK